jgi:hypothetical protein
MHTPFGCPNAATARLSVSGTSSSIRFRDSTTTFGKSVRLTNLGAATAYVEIGDSAVAATVPVAGTGTGGTPGSFPIPSGATQVLNAQGGTYIAAITSSGTADLYATPGDGF